MNIIYIDRNIVKFPNCVGIVPWMYFDKRALFIINWNFKKKKKKNGKFYLIVEKERIKEERLEVKRSKELGEKYNWVTLWGFEESQITPLWPHKSYSIFQLEAKLPFDVNEL